MNESEEVKYIQISNKVRIRSALKILGDVMNTRKYGIKKPKEFTKAYNALYEMVYKDK